MNMTNYENHTFTPCADESQNGCYWNAPTMGNGVGSSYVALPDGTVIYIDGCAPGEGLPSIDFDMDGVLWTYCEPALGNDSAYVATDATVTVPTTEVPTSPVLPDSLAATGIDDVSPLTVILGSALVLIGFGLSRIRRRA
jgi:LPXTG-motif cell wall-anchored protein